MKDSERQGKHKSSPRASQELEVVGVEFTPGPDAEDRLRRAFTILVNHAMTRRRSRGGT